MLSFRHNTGVGQLNCRPIYRVNRHSMAFFQGCPGRGANRGFLGFRLFSLSIAAPLTTRPLRPLFTAFDRKISAVLSGNSRNLIKLSLSRWIHSGQELFVSSLLCLCKPALTPGSTAEVISLIFWVCWHRTILDWQVLSFFLNYLNVIKVDKISSPYIPQMSKSKLDIF